MNATDTIEVEEDYIAIIFGDKLLYMERREGKRRC